MCELVTPHVAAGGIRTAYVMPNLVPPLTKTDAVLAYKKELQRIAPGVEWLMTLYLHPEVTPDEIRKAAKAGVSGMSRRRRGIDGRCQVVPARRDDQLVVGHRGLRRLLPRLQGDGGGGHGPQPARRGAL